MFYRMKDLTPNNVINEENCMANGSTTGKSLQYSGKKLSWIECIKSYKWEGKKNCKKKVQF